MAVYSCGRSHHLGVILGTLCPMVQPQALTAHHNSTHQKKTQNGREGNGITVLLKIHHVGNGFGQNQEKTVRRDKHSLIKVAGIILFHPIYSF